MSHLFQPVSRECVDEFDTRLFHGISGGGRSIVIGSDWRHISLVFRFRQPGMRAVAVRRVPGLLAHTKMSLLGLVDRKCQRRKLSSRVRTVTKRLISGFTARTPVMLTCFEVDLYWLAIGNSWFGHLIVF